MRIGKVRLAVHEGLSRQSPDHAAGGTQYGIAGGDVPFHGTPQPRIKVGFARCHQAELERRAGIGLTRHLASGKESIERLGIAVRAAGDHGEPGGGDGAAGNGTPPRILLDKSAHSLGTGKQPRQRRRQHHAQGRATTFDQRNVDGEFTVAVDEFLGAVQGIHQPEACRHGGDVPGGRRFLGDHRSGGRELRERGQNDGLGPLIRRGDRRGIGLAAHFKVRCVDLENRVARSPRDRQHQLQKFSPGRIGIHGDSGSTTCAVGRSACRKTTVLFICGTIGIDTAFVKSSEAAKCRKL